MAFANPIWLWGFSVLAVPVIIHLLSQKESKIIVMGSLRHLKDANTKQFKSLRINETLLLILRCLIIILLVLFLSGLEISSGKNQKWLLIENEVKELTRTKSLVDSLTKQGYESHELSSPNYWQLISQLNSQGISDAVVISRNQASAFKGERIKQPSSLKWITIDTEQKEYLVSATTQGDSLIVKTGYLQDENTTFKKEITKAINSTIYKSANDSISISSTEPVKVLIAADPAFRFDSKIILAALKTIQKNIDGKLIIKESDTNVNANEEYHWLISLSDKSIPNVKADHRITYKNNTISPLLQHINSTDWMITKRLTEKNVLEDNLTLQLAQILFPNSKAVQVAEAKDQRTLPEQLTWSSTAPALKAGINTGAYSSLDQYLLLLLAILLLTERWIAYKRNQ